MTLQRLEVISLIGDTELDNLTEPVLLNSFRSFELSHRIINYVCPFCLEIITDEYVSLHEFIRISPPFVERYLTFRYK